MLASAIEKQSFGPALALAVATANGHRVYLAPITLGLGMHLRVAINLACGGLQNLGLHPLSQYQHVDCAMRAGFGGLQGVPLTVSRACRAGEVTDFVNFYVQRKSDVVLHQFKTWVVQLMGNITLRPCEAVINTDHFVALGASLVAKMRTKKTCTAGN
jgi:hypothetical protein